MKALFALSVTLFLLTESDTAIAQTEFSDCDGCPTMVEVPAGTARLGSMENTAYRRAGERAVTTIVIERRFAMARSEVTLAQYRQFVDETNHRSSDIVRDGETIHGCNYFDGTGYGFVARHSWRNPGFAQRENEPVVCVSWSDASRYAQWLTEKTGRAYRVPSTVEFEYALRAGSEAPWFWGTNPDLACEYANVGDRRFGQRYHGRAQFNCDDGYIYTTSVERFKPNAFGLYDMLGNAWEWTDDCWHDDLANAPTDGSAWLQGDCLFRVPKGGSWISGPGWARAAVRSKDHRDYRSFMLGFRVAAAVSD